MCVRRHHGRVLFSRPPPSARAEPTRRHMPCPDPFSVVRLNYRSVTEFRTRAPRHWEMDDTPTRQPTEMSALREAAREAGFTMSCEERTGSLLATLAAARPGGRILELGTGVGEGTAWLLSGMGPAATLVTVELDDAVQAMARRQLGSDPRVTFVTDDGGHWLEEYTGQPFDLVFADTWPGKFNHLNEA